MKKNRIFLILVMVLIVTLLAGCHGQLEGDTSKESQQQSEVETEFETETETESVGFGDNPVFEEFDISKIDIEQCIPEAEELTGIIDLYYSEEMTYILVRTYDNEKGRFRIICCNIDDNEFQSFVLDEVDTETGENYWISYEVDKDGNVYMPKSETHYMAHSCIEEGVTIVSWNNRGEIRYEIELNSEDFAKYRGKAVIFQSVTDAGELVFWIDDIDNLKVIFASQDGRFIEEFEMAYSHNIYYIRKAGDRAIGVTYIKEEGRNRERYYQYFDINTRTISEEVLLKDVDGNAMVEDAAELGIDKDHLMMMAPYGSGRRLLYIYNPFTEEITLFGPFSYDGINKISDAYPVTEDSFLLIRNEIDTDSEYYNKLYLYTYKAE